MTMKVVKKRNIYTTEENSRNKRGVPSAEGKVTIQESETFDNRDDSQSQRKFRPI